MALLEVTNVKKIYSTRFGGNKVQALFNVTFSVEEGEYVAIMGESGSGKTTLLNILAALDRPTSGEVLLEGKSITHLTEKEISAFRRKNLGFVFQDFNLLDTFSLRDNIYLPLEMCIRDSIGGEQSGHIIFSRYSATGDGILTSLMIMEACVDQKATLCDLAKEMKVYPQLLRNVRVSDKKTALENEKVKAAIEAAAEALGDDGRILVRESGTEPLIRVMVEAGTDDLCHKYVDSVVDVMEAEGLVVE